jgi:hypothetical protein
MPSITPENLIIINKLAQPQYLKQAKILAELIPHAACMTLQDFANSENKNVENVKRKVVIGGDGTLYTVINALLRNKRERDIDPGEVFVIPGGSNNGAVASFLEAGAGLSINSFVEMLNQGDENISLPTFPFYPAEAEGLEQPTGFVHAATSGKISEEQVNFTESNRKKLRNFPRELNSHLAGVLAFLKVRSRGELHDDLQLILTGSTFGTKSLTKMTEPEHSILGRSLAKLRIRKENFSVRFALLSVLGDLGFFKSMHLPPAIAEVTSHEKVDLPTYGASKIVFDGEFGQVPLKDSVRISRSQIAILVNALIG